MSECETAAAACNGPDQLATTNDALPEQLPTVRTAVDSAAPSPIPVPKSLQADDYQQQQYERQQQTPEPSDNETEREHCDQKVSSVPRFGAEHWKARRQAWRNGTIHEFNHAHQVSSGTEPSMNVERKRNAPVIEKASKQADSKEDYYKNVTPAQYNSIYKMMVNGGRRLAQPMPLELAFKVIVKGWQSDGTWPTSQEEVRARQQAFEEEVKQHAEGLK
ncbi:hypothetical protein GQ42DRAFT_56330 [Ramicandelaber brevisporus]|nr:hypothetical protein GQ42DRAFT_56330 [Ramicandelaber brevisporus]